MALSVLSSLLEKDNSHRLRLRRVPQAVQGRTQRAQLAAGGGGEAGRVRAGGGGVAFLKVRGGGGEWSGSRRRRQNEWRGETTVCTFGRMVDRAGPVPSICLCWQALALAVGSAGLGPERGVGLGARGTNDATDGARRKKKRGTRALSSLLSSISSLHTWIIATTSPASATAASCWAIQVSEAVLK